MAQFHPAAKQEVEEAVEWYENERHDLGKRFAQAVDEAIGRLERFPMWGTEIVPGIYRVLVKKFPYGVLYAIKDETLVVYAIAHLHRKPGYWRGRIC